MIGLKRDESWMLFIFPLEEGVKLRRGHTDIFYGSVEKTWFKISVVNRKNNPTIIGGMEKDAMAAGLPIHHKPQPAEDSLDALRGARR